MTILGFSSSPRRGGNSEKILTSFLQGASQEGFAVEFIRLNDLKIRPCQACDLCAATGICIIQDDMQLLHTKMASCRGVVIATPVFFGTFSAQLKMFIDRFQCWWHAKYHLGKPFIKEEEQRPAFFICVGAIKKKEYCENAAFAVDVFFNVINLKGQGQLFYRGYDEKGVIAKNPENLKKGMLEGEKFTRLLASKES